MLLPALAAHVSWTPAVVWDLSAAFVAFSLLASATYLLNDVADLPHDRQHPTKKHRALAAGHMSTRAAFLLATILIAAAAALAWPLPIEFRATLAAYLILTALYSIVLKRQAVLDVIVLATLYTTRIVAGAAVVDVPLSRWFLAFSVFLFLSLALVKRVVELQDTLASRHDEVGGRGYIGADLPVLVGMGLAAAASSSLVYCLYITGDEVGAIYSRPDLLWGGFLLLLYWETRIWLLAVRKQLHEDPVVFALRDGTSYVVVLTFFLLVWVAT